MADDVTFGGMDGLELDLATAVARLRQLRHEHTNHGTLDVLLLDRVLTCDLPRLEGHLTPRAAALLAEVEADAGWH